MFFVPADYPALGRMLRNGHRFAVLTTGRFLGLFNGGKVQAFQLDFGLRFFCVGGRLGSSCTVSFRVCAMSVTLGGTKEGVFLEGWCVGVRFGGVGEHTGASFWSTVFLTMGA